nr:hypothetical protein [Polymorphobacter sp.]
MVEELPDGVVEPLDEPLMPPDDRPERLLWCLVVVEDVPPVDMPEDESDALEPIDPEPLDPIEPDPLEPVEPAPVDPIEPEPVDPAEPVPAEPLGLICAMAVVPTRVAAAAIAINIFMETLLWIG